MRVQEALALGGTGAVTVLGPPVLPSTFGKHKVLVILLRFLDTPATTLSPSAASIQSMMFGTTGSTVNNFYRENSYQQTWLKGTVVGPFTIPLSSAGCDTDRIAMLAQQALSGAPDVVLGQYQHIVYAFPSSGCVWWGFGSIGGVPGQVWVSGSLQQMVAAHELGHNFGLYHSHALECGTVTMGGSCTSIDYGDGFDVMGGGSGPTHFNAVQKDLLGWLDYGASPPITDVVASGTYTVDALESAGTRRQGPPHQDGPRRLAVRRVPPAHRLRQLPLVQRERDGRRPRPLLRRGPQRRLPPRHDTGHQLVVGSRPRRGERPSRTRRAR